jgi:hypothetical protein
MIHQFSRVIEFSPCVYSQESSITEQRVDDHSSYKFYDLLMINEVIVTESNYTSTPKTAVLAFPTLLQISAFGDKKHATSLAKRLKKEGLVSVRVITRNNPKGEIHLVRTLPYQRYDELKTALQIAERFNQHPLRIQIK